MLHSVSVGMNLGSNSSEIRTNRLLLRRFSLEDMDAYAAIMGDDEVMRWFPNGKGYTREQAKKSLDIILDHWVKHGFGIWAVTDKDSGVLLGRCGLNLIAETSEVEVDFVIARNYWRHGYATEAARAALAYGFDVLKLDRIIALAKPDNVASRRVIEKIGMHYVKDAEYWGIICAFFEVTKPHYINQLRM